MVRHFDHTWVTDWQIAPRSFWIVNGLTMALPPEYVDRVCSGQNSHVRAHLDFQARLVLFGRPTVGLVGGSDLQVERLKHVIDIYKEFVRPFHRTHPLAGAIEGAANPFPSPGQPKMDASPG